MRKKDGNSDMEGNDIEQVSWYEDYASPCAKYVAHL